MGIPSMVTKRRVRSAYAMSSQDHVDTDALLKTWADDGVWDSPSELGVGQTIKGKKAVADWYKKWEEEFPQRKLVPKTVCMKGTFWPLRNNVVMVEYTATETDKQGREYTYDGVTVLQLRNTTKVAKVTEYIAFAGLPQVSDLLKPTGGG